MIYQGPFRAGHLLLILQRRRIYQPCQVWPMLVNLATITRVLFWTKHFLPVHTGENNIKQAELQKKSNFSSNVLGSRKSRAPRFRLNWSTRVSSMYILLPIETIMLYYTQIYTWSIRDK